MPARIPDAGYQAAILARTTALADTLRELEAEVAAARRHLSEAGELLAKGWHQLQTLRDRLEEHQHP